MDLTKDYSIGQEVIIREKYGKDTRILKAVIDDIGERFIYIDVEDGRYLKMNKPFPDRPYASGKTEMFDSLESMKEYENYLECLKVIRKYFNIKKPISHEQASKIKMILEE